jgi:5-(carboxyamino)imidazole ribonucleotide synthase
LITIEIENVNINALKDLEKLGKRVFPQPHIIENIQNKISQKNFFKEHNIPTADFIVVENLADIGKNKDFLPAVNKIATGGYDGKGVQVIRTENDINKGFDASGLLEKLINFKTEIAVIVHRNQNGDIKTFPAVEMAFHAEANLVEYLFSPTNLEESIEAAAEKIAIDLAKAYGIVGTLAVEMFVDQADNILVNEVAPRPHNSGHHTLRANLCSQFDQHWLSILNLPLQNTQAIMPAAMVNLLGAEKANGDVKILGLEKIIALEKVFPYFYGKKTVKPFRKMGHVSILAETQKELIEKVKYTQEHLIITSE